MSTPWPRAPSEDVLRAERIVDILALRARTQPDKLAYTWLGDERTLTYGALYDDARRVATLLLQRAEPGDRAMLLFGSGLDFVRAFLGCHVAGLVPVPVMPPRDASPGELGRVGGIASDAGVVAVVTTPEMASMGQALFPGDVRWLSLEDIGGLDLSDPVPAALAGELALLQYTSGSTSAPRGVMVGHDNLLHNLGDIYWAERNDADTVTVSWLPVSHDMGLIEGVLQPLYGGHPVYLMSPLSFLKAPVRWLETLSRVGATVSGGPNFAYELVLRRLGDGPLPPSLDLSRWRFAYNASEPVRASTIEAFCARLAPAGFRREAMHALYGMAEATLGVTEGRGGHGPRYQARVDGGVSRTVVSCGETASDMHLAVVDPETRRRVGPGEEGEIWLSGPCVTRGYWGRPAETAETFQARIEGEARPYLRTGDLGFVLDGELFISGRLKELILCRGRNLHPEDLERSVEAAHPLLRPGGAVCFRVDGLEDQVGVVAEVRAPRGGPPPEPALLREVAQSARRALAGGHGVPVASVALVPPGTVPRTTSGKRQRLRVSKLWASGRIEPLVQLAAAPQDAAARGGVTARVAAMLGVEPAALDRSLTLPELGLDSLRALELLVDVQLDGAALPVAALLGLSLDALERGGLQTDAEATGAERWRQDAQLPGDLRCAPGAQPPGAGAVLVTGATGFLGGEVVMELLAHTAQRVLGLVRGERGRERLLETLRLREGWRPEWEARVEAIPGDLGAPGLGLSPQAQAALSDGIDAIVHAGAMVNWVYPYRALAPTNVGGTLALLRLASRRATPFVYLSTMACCWSLTASGPVDEDTDPMGHIDGIHLDYVRSKAVSEALVRQAAARGLPTTILRPGLIFSNRRTGQHSPGDFLSALLRGCIEMKAAPDLDWNLDVCPVDQVARVVRGALERPGGALHLEAPERRSWRGVVLWMRLRGYPMALLPYDAWCARLEVHAKEPEAALRPLRGFFTRPVPGLGRLRLPQLYEEPRRNPISSERSAALGVLPRRPLDAPFLERAVAGLVARGYLPAPEGGPRGARAEDGWSPERFEACLQRRDPALRVRSVSPVPWDGDSGDEARHSIVGELASWRYGHAAGIRRFTLDLDRPGEAPFTLQVVAKAQVPGDLAFDIAGEVAALCDAGLGQAWQDHRADSEVLRGHTREAALYALGDPRLAALTPKCYGAGPGLLLLEDLSGLPLLDRADDPEAWGPEALAVAVDGLAQLHAVGLGQTWDAPWMAAPRDASALTRQAPLWEALGQHALRRPFGAWLGAGGRARHAALRQDVAAWAGLADRLPKTLIHNDFSPRNAALRADGTLVVYDWELATVGLPQRDLAELLCFTLTPELPAEVLNGWLERHRLGLEAASGQALDPADWRAGFAAALADFAVTRLPLYAMIDAFRPQRFLERVTRTWAALDALTQEGSP